MNNLLQVKTDDYPQRPRWLDEEPCIARLLNTFLDKLESAQRLSMRITKKTFPELFDFGSGEASYLWSLVKSLNKEFHILTITLAPARSYQEAYENARIEFVPEKESMVRHWLNRPRLDPYGLIWDKHLQKIGHHFEDKGEALAEMCIRVSNYAPEAILQGFVNVGRELKSPMTLRALSARCFRGDSKFLDRREELIHRLYPSASSMILPRPILLTCYVPDNFKQVLFVENQDSFLMLAEQKPYATALVYSAGFRGSATRVRERGNVSFAQMAGGYSDDALVEFEHWWLDTTGEQAAPAYFWGDLDYAGIAILKALRLSFPGLKSWQPGYRLLAEKLQNGTGHPHASSGKELQKYPGNTGCDYADEVLLPAVYESGLFIDQEAVVSFEIEGFH